MWNYSQARGNLRWFGKNSKTFLVSQKQEVRLTNGASAYIWRKKLDSYFWIIITKPLSLCFAYGENSRTQYTFIGVSEQDSDDEAFRTQVPVFPWSC